MAMLARIVLVLAEIAFRLVGAALLLVGLYCVYVGFFGGVFGWSILIRLILVLGGLPLVPLGLLVLAAGPAWLFPGFPKAGFFPRNRLERCLLRASRRLDLDAELYRLLSTGELDAFVAHNGEPLMVTSIRSDPEIDLYSAEPEVKEGCWLVCFSCRSRVHQFQLITLAEELRGDVRVATFPADRLLKTARSRHGRLVLNPLLPCSRVYSHEALSPPGR